MKDLIVVGTLMISFALFITAHVAITFGLLMKAPKWRAPVGFVVVPLAPYWAWREHMRVRAALWAAALILYVVATIVARF